MKQDITMKMSLEDHLEYPLQIRFALKELESVTKLRGTAITVTEVIQALADKYLTSRQNFAPQASPDRCEYVVYVQSVGETSYPRCLYRHGHDGPHVVPVARAVMVVK